MHTHSLLIIDDEPIALKFLNKTLSPRYQTFTAVNARAAINRLCTTAIHLIVCDTMMMNKAGYRICKKIKTHPQLAHIPVIMLTSPNAAEDSVTALQYGAEACVSRPLSSPLLSAQIESTLTSRRKMMRYFIDLPLQGVQPTPPSINHHEFKQRLMKIISDNIDNPHLNVDQLAKKLLMSRSTVYRKIIDTTGSTPRGLINQIRLKSAANLLVKSKFKIYEISYIVGFNSKSSFLRNFIKYFGTSPRQYMRDNRGKSQTPHQQS